jgi:hypothetical protein
MNDILEIAKLQIISVLRIAKYPGIIRLGNCDCASNSLLISTITCRLLVFFPRNKDEVDGIFSFNPVKAGLFQLKIADSI